MEKKKVESTEKALIEAAKKLLLNCDDWTKVTARAITKEAGVNLAMINYCFGSKEALIYAVFNSLQDEVKKCKPELNEILHSDMSPKEKLIEGYFQMLRLMIDYYSMSHSVVKFCVFDRALEMDDGTFTLLKEHFAGEKTDGECLLIAYEIASVHELMAYRYKELQEKCNIDLTDDEVLKKIITENINKLIKEG